MPLCLLKTMNQSVEQVNPKFNPTTMGKFVPILPVNRAMGELNQACHKNHL